MVEPFYSDVNRSSRKVRGKDRAEVLPDEAGMPKEEDYTELRLTVGCDTNCKIQSWAEPCGNSENLHRKWASVQIFS